MSQIYNDRLIIPKHNSRKAVFVGLAVFDVFQLVEQVPLSNEKARALNSTSSAGGPASNAAVCFEYCSRRAMIQQGDATLVTRISNDTIGKVVAKELSDNGVNVVSLNNGGRRTTPTASILITQSSGDRAVVSLADIDVNNPSADISDSDFDMEKFVDDFLHDCHTVVIDGYERDLAIPIARRAKEKNIPVILDMGNYKEYAPELLELTEVAIVSEDFRPSGCNNHNEVLDYLDNCGVTFSAITRGSKSILVRSQGRNAGCPIPHVSDVVDTLGAGDFFHGAFAWYIAQHGLNGDSFISGLKFAADISARSITSFGTRQWMDS